MPYPPQGGAALRNWQNIRALAELGPVDVVSIGTGPGGPPPPPVRRWLHFDLARFHTEPKPLLWLRRKSWWVLARAHPWSTALWHAEVIQGVSELARDGRLVVLEELWLHPYLALAQGLKCLTVFDAHNAEGRLRREMAPPATGIAGLRSRRLAHQVLALERDLVRRADQIWCCSATDAQVLEREVGGSSKLRVVPNTVDVDHYRPVRDGSLAPSSEFAPGRPVIAFVGAYSYRPNELAARILVDEVLPAVQRDREDAALLLVGRDPSPWMLDEARRRPDVRVSGSVADVRPFLAEASVVAVPLTLGGGTRLKILEAFAAARPVVSTAKGAEGLDAIDGQHLHVRETASFAQAILELLANPVAAAGMTARALDFVQQHYSWPSAAARIRTAVAELGAL